MLFLGSGGGEGDGVGDAEGAGPDRIAFFCEVRCSQFVSLRMRGTVEAGTVSIWRHGNPRTLASGRREEERRRVCRV